MASHFKGFGIRSQMTPQSEPIPGSNQQLNNTGVGYSFVVDDMTRLTRFLVLNSAGGTFYVGERELTKQNLSAVEALLKAGRGKEVVDKIIEISHAGRAVSNDPALFALARCCAADDQDVRRYAYDALPKVARTGTHLLHFVEYVKQFRGRGRTHRRAIRAWYQEKSVESLAYQMLKYQQRDGWSQRDVLRLARPHPNQPAREFLYHWAVKGWDEEAYLRLVPEGLHFQVELPWAYEQAKNAPNDRVVAAIIKQHRLPREAVPTEHLKSVRVWEALLEDMPLEAMTRNLATMTRNGVLEPMGTFTSAVAARLRNRELIHKARLHPIKLLAALTTYQSGKSVRGDATWTPLREIIDALDEAFYLSFEAVEPMKKRILLTIDTSGSMHGGRVNGIPNLSCHMAAGAMALVIAKSEPQYHIIGVDTSVQQLPISPRQRLDDVTQTLIRYGGGGTNLSLPMLYALERKLEVDAFVILTDNESWAGNWRSGHPSQALEEYRRRMGIPAKMINVQMTSTHVTNNAPDDLLAMECVGFDTSTPLAINEFLKI
jgi:60 kDa SS-A/Ro ribonucleoprotein